MDLAYLFAKGAGLGLTSGAYLSRSQKTLNTDGPVSKTTLNRRRIDRSMKLKFLGSNFFGCGLRSLRRCASYDRIELEIGPGQASVVLKSPPPDSYPLCPSRLKGFLFSTRSWGKVKTCEFYVKTQIAPSSVRKSLI